MSKTIDRVQFRRNRLAEALKPGAACCKCRRQLDNALLYVRQEWKTPIMPVAAFYYFHLKCWRRYLRDKRNRLIESKG